MFVLLKTNTFKKEIKSFRYAPKVLERLEEILYYLIEGTPIPACFDDHVLHGPFRGYRELHLLPDVLLIYEKDLLQKTIVLAHIGSHSNLYK